MLMTAMDYDQHIIGIFLSLTNLTDVINQIQRCSTRLRCGGYREFVFAKIHNSQSFISDGFVKNLLCFRKIHTASDRIKTGSVQHIECCPASGIAIITEMVIGQGNGIEAANFDSLDSLGGRFQSRAAFFNSLRLALHHRTLEIHYRIIGLTNTRLNTLKKGTISPREQFRYTMVRTKITGN